MANLRFLSELVVVTIDVRGVTPYAVDSEYRHEWKQMSSEEIWASVQKLSGMSANCFLVWGNPAIQDFSRFISLANNNGYDVAMETQGSVYRKWFAKLQHLAISLKPPSLKSSLILKNSMHVLWEDQRIAPCLKL